MRYECVDARCANYTGGKRNFARTRFRDSTRRVQKNHFGRRRLGILGRSLGNGTHSKDEETAPGMSSILLEHAQREISRPRVSFPPSHAEPLGAFTLNPSSSSESSRTGSNLAHILDSGSYSSLRAEMGRVLEFSRTVGLCNYPNSRRQGVLASLASDVDSESELLVDLNQQRNGIYDLPMSEVSERKSTGSP
ncbi:hypothetical protein BJV78DRAFT_818384 [Lactifluus subvellereus]|nr:hypothetical protein BJV78DRAFT_818384 [Lactifluus subvellereus]